MALLTEAIDSGRPADRAYYSLGFRKLCEGDFKAAAAAMDKATTLLKNPLYQEVSRDALLASGRSCDLLAQLAAEGTSISALVERARVCEVAGDKAGADAAAANPATPPDARFAAAKKSFTDALEAGDRDDKRLRKVLETGDNVLLTVRQAMIHPKDKRVYAPAAAIWSPGDKPKLVALSRTLDFQHDATSLALRQLLGDAPAKGAGKLMP